MILASYSHDLRSRFFPILRGSLMALLATLPLACGGDEDPSEPAEEEEEMEESPACEEPVELTDAEFVGGTTLESGTCYLVNEDLNLTDGLVTIEEGVSLSFATDISVKIDAGGTLRILGTEDAPVLFVSQDPLVTWQGIRLEDSQGAENVWEYLVIENGGSRNWTGADYSGAAVYLDGATTLTMDHVTIRGSESHGLVAFEDVSFSFENGTFDENDTPAYLHPNVLSALGGETVFSDNENEHVLVSFGNTDALVDDGAWAALDVPYRVQSRTYVEGALTIEEGAEFEFAQEVELVLRDSGSLTAVGTETAPIIFRGVAPSRGYWKGIALAAGGTGSPPEVGATFDFCEISDAGSTPFSGRSDSITALYMESTSAAQITNTTFSNNASYAIWASSDARLVDFEGNTFVENGRVMLLHPDRVGELNSNITISDNDINGVEISFGNTDAVTQDATWANLGAPYMIQNRIYVDAALTIDAGTVVEGAQGVSMIMRDGTLTVNGEEAEPVTFRGQNEIEDGYWQGLRFETNSAENVLSYANLLHAGSDEWTGAATSDGAIYVAADAQVTLTNVTVGPGGGHGVVLAGEDSGLGCTDVTFEDNVKGDVYDGNSVIVGCP